MKYCGGCRKNKDDSEFGLNRWKKDGLAGRCKECSTAYRKSRDRSSSDLKYRLKKKYKITQEEYERLSSKQNDLCAICAKKSFSKGKSSKLCIDHSHEDGRIRGLLCRKCNVALGNFRDSVEFLGKAIEYLQRYS